MDYKLVESEDVDLWLVQVPKDQPAEEFEGAEVEDGKLTTKDGRTFRFLDGLAVDEIVNVFYDQDQERHVFGE